MAPTITDVVMAIATALLAVFTAALAVSTTRYWRATRDMLTQQRLQARPILTVTAELLYGVMPVTRLSNIGGGAALDVSGQLAIEIEGKIVWDYGFQWELIAPGTFHDFDPTRENEHMTVHQIAKEGRVYSMALRYHDAHGSRYEVARKVSWRHFTEHVFGAGLHLPPPQYEKITKEMQETRRVLDRIADALARK